MTSSVEASIKGTPQPGIMRFASGILVMLIVISVYATNFVAVRYSTQRGLSAYDLVAMRYFVAGMVMLPYFIHMNRNNRSEITWKKGILLTLFSGSPYIMIFFTGISLSPASHGAVLNPGLVPIVVFFGMLFFKIQRFSFVRLILLVLIMIGVAFVTASSFSLDYSVLVGDIILISTGISWGIFSVLTQVWQIKPIQATATVAVLSLVYLPYYFLFQFEGMPPVSPLHFIAQALFQGLVLSIGTHFGTMYGIRTLGVKLASLFSPLVPILTTLLGIVVLDEIPVTIQWIGIVLVISGMLGSALYRDSKMDSR